MARLGRSQPFKPIMQGLIKYSAGAPPSSSIKTKKGVVYASIKTFKGLAAASTKTDKGLA